MWAAIFRFCVGAGLLGLLSISGDFLARLLNLPIPGSILGMIALLALLFAFPHISTWMTPAADALLRWLGALIVPAAAGIVLYGALFRDHALALGLVLVVTTLATGVCIAVIYRAAR
jgi:holin-like protein